MTGISVRRWGNSASRSGEFQRAWSTYNATAPIEVSSAGNTRHHLNLSGNRIVNHAIHIAAVTQLRHDTNGRVYFDRKIREGKTPKEAIRALKRRISDAVYRALTIDAARTATN
jgi:transposase